MKRKTIIRSSFFILGIGVLMATGIIYYMFNMLHPDVKAGNTDYSLKAESAFNLTLAGDGIAFVKGKPLTNVAETVEVT